MNCDCLNIIHTTRHTKICEQCGVETTIPFNLREITTIDSYNTHCPFSRGYSRLLRFKKMIYSILSPCPQYYDNNVLEYLDAHKPFQTQADLLRCLKRAPVKDKRYSSLHLYCKLYVREYVPPYKPENIEQIQREIITHFQDVEFAHHSYGEPFFNYMWLLNFCLNKWGLTDYLKYTKTLKCRNRRRLYEDMYTFCLKIILANKERQLMAYA